MGAALRVVIERGDPFLGICMGMQLLFDGSDENGGQEGLHVLPGRCRRFPDGQEEAAEFGAVELAIEPAGMIPAEAAPAQSVATSVPAAATAPAQPAPTAAAPTQAPASEAQPASSGGDTAQADGDVPPPPTWSGPTAEEVDHGTTITMEPVDEAALAKMAAEMAAAEPPAPVKPPPPPVPARLMRRIKVPHMGWNEVEPTGSHYYFVHSYYVEPERSEDVMWMSRYGGIRFPAAVRRGNVMGCQFHPEKSQRAGLRFLRAFLLGGWG